MVAELSYSKSIIQECKNDELIKEFINYKLLSYHSTTRRLYFNGRITELITSHKLFNDLKINSISSDDRFMFCGSMGLNNDLKKIMIENNFHEGANNYPGEFVLEKAFVD